MKAPMRSPFLTWQGVIEHYRDRLPVTEATPVVTLLEGATPLTPAASLSERLGGTRVFLKMEGMNPTCSFKDRGMTVALSKAVENGAKAVICASTGNTSASAAAYAARAGIACAVLVPQGEIAFGKAAQAVIHQAALLSIEGSFDQALELVRAVSESYPIALVNSLNPHRIEGQKTAAFEICDQLGRPPDCHALPVGNAGNIVAYWKGYREYRRDGVIDFLPKMLGFQAAKAAPIVDGAPVEKPETVASAIKIGNPASWKRAVRARDESGGLIEKVTDRQILEAYRLLAGEEGVFVEPASAVSVAGVLQLGKRGFFNPDEIVVCVLTGHGLKDPERAVQESREPKVVPAKIDAVVKEIFST